MFGSRHRLLPALGTAAPALRDLLALGQTVVARTPWGESHAEGSLDLHRTLVNPQPGVAHTRHLAENRTRLGFISGQTSAKANPRHKAVTDIMI